MAAGFSLAAALEAIARDDGEAIETLRTFVRPEHFAALLRTWRASLPWPEKDLYIALVMDHRDAALESLMRDALTSPTLESRAYALCYFRGFEVLKSLEAAGGWLDGAKVDAAVAEWHRQARAAAAAVACEGCGAPIVAGAKACKYCGHA